MGPNKVVHLIFLSGGLILFFLLYWTEDWLVGYVVRNPNEYLLQGVAAIVALGAGITLYRNERVYTLASEVALEVKKVTWPTWKETKAATLVVIVTVAIASIMLGAFDMVWSFITNRLYGG